MTLEQWNDVNLTTWMFTASTPSHVLPSHSDVSPIRSVSTRHRPVHSILNAPANFIGVDAVINHGEERAPSDEQFTPFARTDHRGSASLTLP